MTKGKLFFGTKFVYVHYQWLTCFPCLPAHASLFYDACLTVFGVLSETNT